MNSMFSSGALIPLWILGAGLIAGVMQLLSTPRSARRDRPEQGLPRNVG